MPASSRSSPLVRSSRCLRFTLGLALAGLTLGCPKPSSDELERPDVTAAPAPTTAATSKGPEAPTGPVVLFAVSDGVLAPLACHDGAALLESDTQDCMDLAPVGEVAGLDDGRRVTLGEPTDAPCNASELNRFDGRAVTGGPLDTARFAVWPLTASTALELRDAALQATAEELAAMTALLEADTNGLFEVPPKLEVTSGLIADLDGDGAPDRVFATHEGGRLYGVIAAFLGRAPKAAVSLSVMQFDAPRIVGVTDLDGRPGQEVLVEALFVEGIEDQNVVSAISYRVLGLEAGVVAQAGSWGCRMF
ncbi:hypothetical protein [Paraliomyxa miuraensis]|uniref:hypothetical protein n=1 Tax=Paraliomyxa miuraensis TaxID=376150 RepID=UPI00224FF291|nr:hypothetical protein [Paraliomyxa miuraensis]MCX4243989.1 hypothetical protein [Paraliomyxa miuraensis]